MRRLIWLCALIGLTVAGPSAQQRLVTYEPITIGATAIGITAAITNPPGMPQQNVCEGRLETAQIRYRYDGVDPTATEGTLVEVGDWVKIENNADARAVRFIRTGGTSGMLKLHCRP